jgi:hypothetical protein
LLTGDDNSKAGNVAYKVKEPTLKASQFSLTNMTAGKTHWGKNEIEARQEELAMLAAKTWPL